MNANGVPREIGLCEWLKACVMDGWKELTSTVQEPARLIIVWVFSRRAVRSREITALQSADRGIIKWSNPENMSRWNITLLDENVRLSRAVPLSEQDTHNVFYTQSKTMLHSPSRNTTRTHGSVKRWYQCMQQNIT